MNQELDGDVYAKNSGGYLAKWRLTTYDPFLLFIGKEYITPETGLVIDLPDTSLLPFE